MAEIVVRKYATCVEEILHEGGPLSGHPLRRASGLAVIANPFAGSYHPEISPFMELLKPLGLDLAHRLVSALGGNPKMI